jgi:hypothetical protein
VDYSFSGSAPESCNIGIESPDQTMGHDLGRYVVYNEDVDIFPHDYATRLFGRQLALSNPYIDTLVKGSAGTCRIEWAEILRNSGGMVYLYYDDGTDTTGILIDSVPADDGNAYDWTPVFTRSTQVYVYGVLRDGAETTVSYALGRVKFAHPSLEITAPLTDTSVDSTCRIAWTDTAWSSGGMVYVYYDDGTDTTGTLIDSLSADGLNHYDWTPTVPAGMPLQLYVRLRDNGEWATVYAPGRVTFDHPVPVTLASFTAQVIGPGVTLTWTTASEQNNLGWNVYRSIGGALVKVNTTLIPGAGTTVQSQQYQFADVNAPAGSLTYRLEQVDVDGVAVWAGQAVTQNSGATGIRLPQIQTVVKAQETHKLGALRTLDGTALTGAVRGGVYLVGDNGVWRKIVVVE